MGLSSSNYWEVLADRATGGGFVAPLRAREGGGYQPVSISSAVKNLIWGNSGESFHPHTIELL